MVKHTTFIIILILFFAGCRQKTDYETMRAEILTLHRELIRAHLENDVDFILKDIADNFISVSRGEITYPTREELRTNFTNYLNNTKFSEYRDLQEPVVGFSADGSTAWSVVQVKVAGSRRLSDNTTRDFDITWAWLTLYERQDDRWIRKLEVSNAR